jgi:hypothetical protein
MATNIYFNAGVKSEQNLYEDIVIESLKMYGQDVYYIPRDIVNKDPVFADDIPSRFNSSYRIEMYIENNQGFDGQGDLFTKFGVEIRDQATFIVARKRWSQTVKRYDNEITGIRPREGDLIFLTLSNSLFEIMKVDHEQPFYQLNNLPTYRMQCELFEYNDEQLNTGIDSIDDIETRGYIMNLTLQDSDATDFVIGNTITQALPSGVIVTGEIVGYNDSDNVVSIAHIGSDDSLFHEFVTAVKVTTTSTSGSTFVRTVTAVNELLNDLGAQNNDFKNESLDFVDFSESNPFGSIGL